MGNCLYIEWFSKMTGRVVIESADYKITVSMPEWTLSAEEEKEQAGENHEAMREWFEQLLDQLPEEDDPEEY